MPVAGEYKYAHLANLHVPPVSGIRHVGAEASSAATLFKFHPEAHARGGRGGAGPGKHLGKLAPVRLHQAQTTTQDGTLGVVREGFDAAVDALRLKPFLPAPLSPRRRG